jgi:hypothetical protein
MSAQQNVLSDERTVLPRVGFSPARQLTIICAFHNELLNRSCVACDSLLTKFFQKPKKTLTGTAESRATHDPPAQRAEQQQRVHNLADTIC